MMVAHAELSHYVRFFIPPIVYFTDMCYTLYQRDSHSLELQKVEKKLNCHPDWISVTCWKTEGLVCIFVTLFCGRFIFGRYLGSCPCLDVSDVP